jgi:hypothetical protein
VWNFRGLALAYVGRHADAVVSYDKAFTQAIKLHGGKTGRHEIKLRQEQCYDGFGTTTNPARPPEAGIMTFILAYIAEIFSTVYYRGF